jgi:hypothetical protein
MRETPFAVFPEHALLCVVERLKEHREEGIDIPSGISLEELALRVVVAAALIESRVEP